MSGYERPWWLIINKPPGLIVTVTEESHPDERIFIIHGEPQVQGLAWLTWGPVAAVLTVLLLAALALALNVREQSTAIRGVVIVAFLGLPALAWAATTLLLNRLSQKHLQAERHAETRECIIQLCQNSGELVFWTSDHPKEQRLAFGSIHQARVTRPIGERGSKSVRLTLDTDDGPITLLDETLGTQIQKVDLANEIQKALRSYAGN